MSNPNRFSVVLLKGNIVRRVFMHGETKAAAKESAKRLNWINEFSDVRAVVVPSR